MSSIKEWASRVVLGVALASAGCVTEDHALSSDLDGDLAALPGPAVWQVAPELLDPQAGARQREVDRYIAGELYRGYAIVETTQTYAGDLVDWVDPDTVPGSQIEAPPPIPAAELVTPTGVVLQRTELDEHPELRGPEGTIPFTRPRFADYVSGGSGHLSLAEYLDAQQGGQPAGWNRLYAGYWKPVANTMVTGFIDNLVAGQIEPGTFSLVEMATYCPGSNVPYTAELVGAVISRDLASFGDAYLRLRVEFFTAGWYQQGNNVGGWDGKVSGFVAAAGRPYGPNATTSASIPGGAQYESHFKIQNFNGNWWIAHNGNWLGYYPGWMFDLIRTRGCQAQWYGEVYDPTPTSWTWTDMGAGYHASAGFRWAAYVRNPYYVAPSGVSYWPDSPIIMGPADARCYTESSFRIGAPPWDRSFYLGGPGGDAYGCD